MNKRVFAYCFCLVTVLVGLVGCSKQRLVASADATSNGVTSQP